MCRSSSSQNTTWGNLSKSIIAEDVCHPGKLFDVLFHSSTCMCNRRDLALCCVKAPQTRIPS
uniref:Uncharacterized protein n=1 Tax=Anguilla anguilla TaxID=7936 RepID=A0A0E9W5F8_ANGAN